MLPPLLIESPGNSWSRQPITVGVPFPRGILTDPGSVRLLDSDGRQAPLQTSPLAHWSDGSVKWLLLDSVLRSIERGCSLWNLARPSRREDESPLEKVKVSDTPNSIVVETGPATFQIGRSIFEPLTSVVVNGTDILNGSSTHSQLTDAQGRKATGRVEQIAIEANGPVRATVRLEGHFTGRVACRFLARLCFFAGTSLVRIRLTLHNPNRARHRGGLWDLGDSGSVLFRGLSLELALKSSPEPRITWRTELEQPVRSTKGELEIYQDSSGGENWQSKNHVNRHGSVACSFRGYRVRTGDDEETGLRASPVLSILAPSGSLTVAVPEFWQQFPKALEVKDGFLRVGLFPNQFRDLFELQGGEQKTHTIWLHFGPGEQLTNFPLDWVHLPAVAHAPSEWYARSEVIPYFWPPSNKSSDSSDSRLAEVVRGPHSLFEGREVIDEYGWRNYGDIYADHEAAYYQGPSPVISHCNNLYDMVYGFLLQYLRTGEVGWYQLFDSLARHVIDIDIYHTDQDKAAYNGGLFWFTDHYRTAATSSHRTYSRENRRSAGRSYGGGPSSEHNFTAGLLHYYYMTGDANSRDAVIGLANWVIKMDDKTRNILGLIDDGPTGLASRTSQLGYHGPGRGCGNSVNALLDAWLVTGQRTYLDKAENLIRRCVHPADDIAARDLLNVERRWSYTVFLSALARYLATKSEAGELDYMYAYARSSLLRYARWMLENEEPYFDHPEKLEYPTETWAAQELRKANVLRLSAEHADEPLRADLLARGSELADRAWSDLLRFESRGVARATAILMTEGSRDAYFRARAVKSATPPSEACVFGVYADFVPQRLRVLAQLKTFRGLVRALLSLADVRRWRDFFQSHDTHEQLNA